MAKSNLNQGSSDVYPLNCGSSWKTSISTNLASSGCFLRTLAHYTYLRDESSPLGAHIMGSFFIEVHPSTVLASPTSIFYWIDWQEPLSPRQRLSSEGVATQENLLRNSNSLLPINSTRPAANTTQWASSNRSAFDLFSLTHCLIFVWAVGCTTRLLFFWREWQGFKRFIEVHQVESDDPTVTSIQELSRSIAHKLSIPIKRFRTKVIDAPISPAVFGLLHPVLLMPKRLFEQTTPAQRNMLLTHELVHLQRHDLAWSCLHLIAATIGWFNPWVHWGVRKFNQETERCCDEETISFLNCSRIDYAKCLLWVLESRSSLTLSPGVLGIQGSSETRERIVRIMESTDVFKIRSRWWYRGILVCGALLLLPEALPLAAQNSGTNQTESRAIAIVDGKAFEDDEPEWQLQVTRLRLPAKDSRNFRCTGE